MRPSIVLLWSSLSLAVAFRQGRRASEDSAIADIRTTSLFDDKCSDEEKRIIEEAYMDAAKLNSAAKSAWDLAVKERPDMKNDVLNFFKWSVTRAYAKYILGLNVATKEEQKGSWSWVQEIFKAQADYYRGESAFVKLKYYCHTTGKESVFIRRNEKDPDSALPDVEIQNYLPANWNGEGIWSFRGRQYPRQLCRPGVAAVTRTNQPHGPREGVDGIIFCQEFFNREATAVAKILDDPTGHGLTLDNIHQDRAHTMLHEQMHWFGNNLKKEGPVIDQPAVNKEGRELYVDPNGGLTTQVTNRRARTYGIVSVANLAVHSGHEAAVNNADSLALLAWTRFARGTEYRPNQPEGKPPPDYALEQRQAQQGGGQG